MTIITSISPPENIDLAEQDATLSAEQSVVFMDVIAESLHISQRSQLFNWLQGGLQFLLGHEVMIFGIKPQSDEPYQFEYFTSTRYFDLQQFTQAIDVENGLIYKVLRMWEKTSLPIFVSSQLSSVVHRQFSVLQMPDDVLKHAELGDFIAHGFGDGHSFVVFARLHKIPSANHARILEMMMPHLHGALIRVTGKRSSQAPTASKLTKRMTSREAEVIQWVHMGKTNWEISTILNISPLTVKNHVQNIIRKLDVQNRRQAAVKAAKMGLIKL